MSKENEEITRLEVLDSLANRVIDIKNSYSSLVDKMKRLIDEVQNSEDKYMTDDLIEIFSAASKNTEIMIKILKDVNDKIEEEENKDKE